MSYPERQNVILMNGNDRLFAPGKGWASFAGIFQAQDKCVQLGEVVGTSLVEFKIFEEELDDIANTFANATEPPLNISQRQELLYGIENAVREEHLRMITGVNA